MAVARAVQVDPGDSVATLLDDAGAGETIEGLEVVSRRARSRAATRSRCAPIPAGDPVTQIRLPDRHRHTRRSRPASTSTATIWRRGSAATLAYRYEPAETCERTARARLRDVRLSSAPTAGSGRATRSGSCPRSAASARTALRIAGDRPQALRGRVDGVHAFAHPFGCSQLGDDLDGTRAILASLACHPNAGGVLIVGLGCEENQLDALLGRSSRACAASAIRTLAAQASADEVAEGCALVAELAERGGLRAHDGKPRPTGAGREVRRLRRPVGTDRQSAGRADRRPGRARRRAA